MQILINFIFMRRLITPLIFPFLLPLSFLIFGPVAIIASKITGTGTCAHSIAKIWARFVLSVCGVKVIISGRDNVPLDRPVIFACNHTSQVDILVLYLALPVEFRFVVKEELFRIPIMGMAMKAADYIPIKRSGGKAALRSLSKAARQIKAGASVVIFPEGTRSPDGRLAPFKPGGFLLATRSECPVVPVAISGSNRILRKGSFVAHPGTVKVTIGKPVPVQKEGRKLKREELMHETWHAVDTMLSTTITDLP